MGATTLEGFSLSHVAVLDPATGEEDYDGSMYGVRSASVTPDATKIERRVDDRRHGFWQWIDGAQLEVRGGFLPLRTWAALSGDPLRVTVGTTQTTIETELWSERSANSPVFPVRVLIPAKDSDGHPATLDVVLYRVRFDPLSFEGVEFKSGMTVNYTGEVLQSMVDETGAALSRRSLGRIVAVIPTAENVVVVGWNDLYGGGAATVESDYELDVYGGDASTRESDYELEIDGGGTFAVVSIEDLFDRADGLIDNAWTDWADVLNPGAPTAGDSYDRTTIKSTMAGWNVSFHGRTAVSRETNCADGFELELWIPADSEIVVPGDTTTVQFCQPGPIVFANPGSVDDLQGLQPASDVTLHITGRDGVVRWAYYLWNVQRRHPNIWPGDVKNFHLMWPVTAANGGIPVKSTIRVVNHKIAVWLNDERMCPPIAVPAGYLGRTHHGFGVTQGFDPATWADEPDRGLLRPWTFRPYTTDLGAYPTAPVMGTPTPAIKANPGSTITPTWPTDVAAGKLVIVVIGHISPGGIAAPSDGRTWQTGVLYGGAAGTMRWDGLQVVCDGTETPGGPIATFTYPTTAGQAAVATAFTISNAHPALWGLASPSTFTPSGSAPTTGSGPLLNRNARAVWISMSTGADVSVPTGWAQMLRSGAGGLNTLNLCIGTNVLGLADGESQHNITVAGSISPAGAAVTGMGSWWVDPR